MMLIYGKSMEYPPDFGRNANLKLRIKQLEENSGSWQKTGKTEEVGFQVVKDPADKSKLTLAINGQLIGEWFKEQLNKLSSSIRRTATPLKSKRLEL